MGNTVIQLRNDTAANWASSNPVLALGEMGLETDTNKFKFGDGSTAWNSLPYVGAGASFKYGEYALSADQASNVATNNHIEFDTLVDGSLNAPSTGSGQAKGIITLPAGKTYKIQLILRAIYSNPGGLTVQMYNRTTSTGFGMQIGAVSSTYSSTNSSNGCTLVAFITTTTDIDIEARITGNQWGTTISSNYTRLIIEEYGGY